MNGRTRTQNSIRNITVSLAMQCVSTLIAFVGRTFFVKILGREYLGVSGLFSNILSVLALAEMGVGSAIVFSLYKPLAERDEGRIRALMALYKRAYTAIGAFVLIAGCSLAPFIGFFVKEVPNIPHFRLIYVLFAVNNAAVYFASYKAALINADQNQYITASLRQFLSLVMNAVQIAVLYAAHSYILYLAVMIVFTVLQNLALCAVADRLYPFLKKKNPPPLPSDERSVIVRNVRAMLMHKVGGVAVDCTDNILISKLVGVAAVGLYSNYYLVVRTLRTLTDTLFTSLVSSVGNLGATQGKDKIFENFRAVNLAVSYVSALCFVCLFNLFSRFISLWLGGDYLLSGALTFVICLNFYLTSMRTGLLVFRSALGLFYCDRFKAVFEAVVNLVVSVVLGKMYGVFGILTGTAVSTVCVCLVFEPCVVIGHALGESVPKYYLVYFLNFALTLAIAYLVRFVLSDLHIGGVFGFFVSAAVSLAVPSAVFWVIFRNTGEFKIFKLIFKNIRKCQGRRRNVRHHTG